MVCCIILDDTEIKELKFRLVKNTDFVKLLEKKTTHKAKDFKLVKIFKFNNNFIHIYGYVSGEEEQLNSNCIPDVQETLYGDIIVCKFVDDSCVDLRVEEYEDFFIYMLEYDNDNEKELIDIDDEDEDEEYVEDMEHDITKLVVENNNNFDTDDVYIDDNLNDNISIDYKTNIDVEKIELNNVNIELEKEEYDYSYI